VEAVGVGDGASHAPVLPADRASRAGSILLGALGASMVAARFETLALAFTAALAATLVVRAPWPSRGWFTALAWGAGIAIALNLYLNPGAPLPLPTVFGRAATQEGLFHGILLAARVFGAALALHGLRAAWPGERAADELAWRVGPLERFGVPVAARRATLALALRFAPLLAAERRRIVQLQRLRAGRAPRTMRERLDEQRAVTVPAVVAALEMAERVALGLEARHYRVRPVPRRTGGGWAAAGGAVVFLIAALWRR
jgi:energy-coupling factor transporter transmembrane protein EcfT